MRSQESSLLDELASSQFHRNRGRSVLNRIRSVSFSGPKRRRRSTLTTTPNFGVAWRDIATSAGAYFFLGFVDFRPRSSGNAERDPYNSVAMLSPDGRAISQYDKVHLVPFGEYIPYQSLFFFVDKISTEAGNFRPGNRVVVTPLDNQRSAGTFVCYEAVVPDLVTAVCERW